MGRSEISCRILQSARKAFKAKGYEGASMREIAQRAGYTTGVLYSRYKDKEELFSAVVKFGEMAITSLCSGRNDIGIRFSHLDRKDVVGRLLSIIDVVSTYKDTVELLIRCSKDSSKGNYIEDFTDKESILKSYIFDRLISQGISNNSILFSLSHNLAVAIYRTLFNFTLDFPKEDVVKFLREV
ncbi:MAG: TetR/AcrR family transcriptional regulator [Clostridia bacterium]|nr:TetR/AcrR family transcriptional regulator [Clostridia bacterium]